MAIAILQSLVEDTVIIPVAGPGKFRCRGEIRRQATPCFPKCTLVSKGSADGLGMSLLELPGTEMELEKPEMKREILDQIQ